MSGLGPEARALLDAAREGLSPSPAAIHRVRAKVGASAAAGTAAGATLAVKLSMFVVVAATAIGAGVYASKRGPDPEVPRVELAPATVEAPTQLAVHEAAAPPAIDIQRAPVVVVRPHPHVAATVEPPVTIDLAREVELVDAAMGALKRGDPQAALAAVQRHAIETRGAGQLAEDAAAIEVEALCRLHDPSTNSKLEAFDARFPRSAQRSRLSNRCP